MNPKKQTRRDFIKTATGSIAALSSFSIANADATNIKPFTFVQVCDTQLGFGGYEHDIESFKQTVKQINALKPDFVLVCGDLVNTADEKSFSDFNTIKAGLSMPCYCVAGNHDIGNTPSLQSLQFYSKAVDKQPNYSFDHKGAAFIIVNTQLWKAPLEVESERQDAWLKTTLEAAANKQSPVFIVGHYPLFLKTPDEEEEYMNLPLKKRKELLQLYETHGVVAVLGGHTHRLLINNYKGIQLVNGEATSRHFDERPLGFRLWHVDNQKSATHEFIALKEF